MMASAARAQDATPTPSADQTAKPAKPKKAAKAKPATDAATPAADATKTADDSKKPVAKPKSDKGAVTISVINKRDVALKSLTAFPSGADGDPKKVIAAVKPGKRGVGHVARTKDCLYDLHGDYDDGSVFEASSVDLCKSGAFNLKD